MRVLVDLTPVLPGGTNGGAKPFVLSLLANLVQLQPDWEFIFLTSASSHSEISSINAPNVQSKCVIGCLDTEQESRFNKFFKNLAQFSNRLAKQILPGRIYHKVNAIMYRYRLLWRSSYKSLPSQMKADLLFCPFTDPVFYDPQVPTLSIIYDLQFLDYPIFFSDDDILRRQRALQSALQYSTHLVTISDFVRESVISRFPEVRSKTSSIPIGAPKPLLAPSAEGQKAILDMYDLKSGQYLLYPANFWQHKNHENLLVAFRLFREKYPENEFKLVLTGALEDRRALLEKAASQMELSNWVCFAGFLPEESLAALYKNARALIFPSLYEGFGMPVLEAMRMGVPVACSQVTSLPEVGGDAVLYFNPHVPVEIMEAIEQLVFDDQLCKALVEKGSRQALKFKGIEDVSRQYAILMASLQHKRTSISTYGIEGYTADGWLKANTFFFFPDGKARKVSLSGNLPAWIPFPITIMLQDETRTKTFQEQRIFPGQNFTLQTDLPEQEGFLHICCFPPYCPAEWGETTDTRLLGCRLENIQVIDVNSEKLLWRSENGVNH